MELKWLLDFLSLSHVQNFTLAAEDRNITQSALSRRIRQLEDWVGLPLVDRSTSPIRLTSAGESFLPKARQAAEFLAALRDETLREHDTERDVLSFATMSTLAMTFFPVWIKRIEASGGPFRTRFTEGRDSFATIVSKLVRNECDFLLTYSHDAVPVIGELGGYPFLSLGQERVIAVSAPAADGSAQHRVSLDGPPASYLGYSSKSFFAEALPRTVFKRSPLPLTTVYENALSAALKATAISGRGLAWVPESLVEREMDGGLLVRASGPEFDLIVETRLYRSFGFRSARAKHFWRVAEALGPIGEISSRAGHVAPSAPDRSDAGLGAISVL